jgi:23S rRNA-intervening sequence protein
MEIQNGYAVKAFRELKVWQKAHELTLVVYQLTATFPREELYGLTTQLRRSSSSIAANLRGADGTATPSSLAFVLSPWDRRASWNITCCWPET